MSIDWLSEANAINDQLIERRRDLHRHPEIAFQEIRTAGIVAQTLTELGIEVTTGIGKTGVVGVLEGDTDGPTVLVRFDMDALPIAEANTTDYISETPGKMHACGHDGHTAIGLGVARLLNGHRDQIAGRVKFLFQPAEEIARGAQAMIDDGALLNPAPEVSLGLHLWSGLPVGEVAVTDGPTMAGADLFKIILRGSGGHAATPDLTRDPVIAGAHIVTALQTIVSRNVSALDTAVVSVSMFHAGDANNVIPAVAHLEGTFRTYRPEIHDRVERRLREIVNGIAAAMGCEAHIETLQVTPPLVNDPAVNTRLRRAFGPVRRAAHLELRDDAQTMTAEDMAVILQQVPGSFFFVGAGNPMLGSDFPHHHPRFDIDESVLPISVALLCSAVADYVMPE